tara:strand:+ start:179 stop:886 length:708 start_codon:yes stop_codon:yes gene_type:complete
MALPKIQQPLFDITVPSTQQKTTFRAFTVKEEKILLTAQESGDPDQIILAIKQILGNTLSDVDIEKLAMFDIEYLLLKIRGQSVNNLVEFKIKDPDTEEDVDVSFDINDVELKFNDEHSKEIILNDNFKLIMRYATINELTELTKIGNEKQNQALFEIMVKCIDCLVEDEDTVYKFSDFSEKEVTEFMDSLTGDTINGIKKFFETTPVMRIELPYTNSKGNNKTFVVEGVQSFFI